MGLERRLLFGLNTDRPQPLNYVCVTLENRMSVREERHSPKKPDCPGRNEGCEGRSRRCGAKLSASCPSGVRSHKSQRSAQACEASGQLTSPPNCSAHG